jgi:hypothetical protein
VERRQPVRHIARETASTQSLVQNTVVTTDHQYYSGFLTSFLLGTFFMFLFSRLKESDPLDHKQLRSLGLFLPHHHSFTGWVDVALSPKGEQEAKEGGALIKEAGIDFDVAFTSLQKRAIKTCFLALESADQLWIPQKRSWRLNERMYGDLEGMNKNECVEKYGADQVCCIFLSWKGNRCNSGRAFFLDFDVLGL